MLFTPADTPFGYDLARGRGLIVSGAGFAALQALEPLSWVDEASIAAVVVTATPLIGHPTGSVVRLFHTDVPPGAQCALLDTDPLTYIESLAEELAARSPGMRRVLHEIGPAYEASHITLARRPRDYVVRPLRMACQNVIVAYAAIAQESSFDGLNVLAWQTCEVPHVATHEANRGLAALTLCDAYRNGGTMEIRFDRPGQVRVGDKSVRYAGHVEGQVPASLRRYARTVGVTLGTHDRGAIFPDEARALFLAVTPMPASLAARATTAMSDYGIPPERLCYALLATVWSPLALDLILAMSWRADSILAGGAHFEDRLARQAESEVCRSAIMIDMYYRRVCATDSAGATGELRVIEDRRRPVVWEIDPAVGAVRLTGLDETTTLPWARRPWTTGNLVVFPRTMWAHGDLDAVVAVAGREPVAIMVPRDTPIPAVPDSVSVLVCPDRLADIDRAIEAKMLSSRVGR